ncbi:MAG: TrkA C-terminal domain-containing protein, partial [Prevotella sp.]|nr:TrkA C-terminal domain-containing protein [Prevotella sp.]
LWAESNRNRLPLLFTILVRFVIAINFVFIVCRNLSHFGTALLITVGTLVLVTIILSRTIKQRSILLERLFINNLRSREIEAEVHGKKRPLYEGKLLDRDIHIAEFDIPQESVWLGKTLKELILGCRYGVHVSSILRGNQRLNIPDGDSQLYPLDRIQVIGSDQQLAIFGQAIQQQVINEEDIEHREMKLRQMIITERSRFVGKTLQESGIRSDYGCMVVGLEEGKENLSSVAPSRKFKNGDIIWIVGEQQDIDRLLKA